MNVFGIGGWELVLVLLIMLIVAGPKRMATWAYTLGRWTAKLRTMWEEVAVSFEAELKESGIDIELPKTPPTRANLQRTVQDYGKKVLEATGNPEDEFKKIRDDLEGVGKEVKSEVDEVNRAVKASTASTNGVKQPSRPAASPPPPPADNDTDESASDYGTWGGNN